MIDFVLLITVYKTITEVKQRWMEDQGLAEYSDVNNSNLGFFPLSRETGGRPFKGTAMPDEICGLVVNQW